MKRHAIHRTALIALGALALAAQFHWSSPVHAAESGKKAAKPAIYTLDTCPITGKALGSMGKPIARVYEGREVRFCCAGCPNAFEKNLKASLEKLDRQIIAKQKASYPLSTCPVTGEKLGGKMGKAVDYVHGNRLVRLCCMDCVKKFKKDPAKFLKKLDAAIVAKQQAKYPVTTCLVTGETLGGKMGKPIDYVYGQQLVRFCCKGCVKKFEQNPEEYIGKLKKAYAAAAGEGHSSASDEKAHGDAGTSHKHGS